MPGIDEYVKTMKYYPGKFRCTMDRKPPVGQQRGPAPEPGIENNA